MIKLTKEQAIIITGFTGTMCCKFDEFHADVEKRLKRPVQTIEFGFNWKSIKEAYRDDFMKLIGTKIVFEDAAEAVEDEE